MIGRVAAICAFVSLLVATLVGCQDDDVLPPDAISAGGPVAQVDHFDLAWESFARMAGNPPGEAFPGTIERLNQWSLTNPLDATWRPDLLVAQLPPSVRGSGLTQRLESTSFFPGDAAFLHETILMWEASRFVVGDASDPLVKAQRLFDWTLRNVQLELPSTPRLWPRESLLVGRAVQIDREWVFLMLARQQELDVVWLATLQDEDTQEYRLWCPALLHDGELYLFDLLWGAPISGPGGEGVATLSQVAQDDSLLRALDVRGKPYHAKAAEMSGVAALIPAREQFLSRRMRAVQERLPEAQRPVLSVDVSKLAAQLQKVEYVASAQLWTWPLEYGMIRSGEGATDHSQIEQQILRQLYPFRVGHVIKVEDKLLREGDSQGAQIVERGYEANVWPLWAGRLHHLAGRFETESAEESRPERQTSAIPFYLIARAKRSELQDIPQDVEMTPEQRAQLKNASFWFARLHRDATFWLGLIRYEQGDYATAADYFRRTLQLQDKGPDADAVRYNLGRTYEAMGDQEKANEQYRKERSPASLLRVRPLETKPSP